MAKIVARAKCRFCRTVITVTKAEKELYAPDDALLIMLRDHAMFYHPTQWRQVRHFLDENTKGLLRGRIGFDGNA